MAKKKEKKEEQKKEEKKEENTDVGYCTSKNSSKFHKSNCYYVKNIITENKGCFGNIQDVKNHGKKDKIPCSYCKPLG